MKIYFAASIRGGRDDGEIYLKLIEHLKKYGPVLTEHIADSSLTARGENKFSDEEIYIRDLDWLKSADVVIAEVTNPSFGVGYELGRAEILGKPILCLFRDKTDRRLSAMISGNSRLIVKKYAQINEALKHIDSFFA
ncbi:MAG TPA: nucleoside 2-deoxyribosyltransferase [Candidatus Nanoarchaeia archaeon]|nr:nucleoside 2-deoxyribosyltransferase [Candidatus Nanoarchaeia archaeon]